MTYFHQITYSNKIPIAEDEVAVKPYVEKPKPKEKDPLDVDGDMEAAGDNPEAIKEENPEGEQGEEGENKPKFKPEDWAWTNYDGKPRNYVQTLHRLKKLPIEQATVERVRDLNPFLLKALTTHMKNWEEDQTYSGVINLTRLIEYLTK